MWIRVGVWSTVPGAGLLSMALGGHTYARMSLNLAPIVVLGEWVVHAGTLTTCVHAMLSTGTVMAVGDRAPAWVVLLTWTAEAAFGGTASLLSWYAGTLTTCVPSVTLGVISGVTVVDRAPAWVALLTLTAEAAFNGTASLLSYLCTLSLALARVNTLVIL